MFNSSIDDQGEISFLQGDSIVAGMHKFILLRNQAIAVDCATGLTRLLAARSFAIPCKIGVQKSFLGMVLKANGIVAIVVSFKCV